VAEEIEDEEENFEDRAERNRLDREKRLARRLKVKNNEASEEKTTSGRPQKKPQYLKDYDNPSDEGAKLGKRGKKKTNSSSEEFEANYDEEVDDDGDSSEEEYIEGRYKKVAKGGRNRRGNRNVSSSNLNMAYDAKRQKLSEFPDRFRNPNLQELSRSRGGYR